MRLFLSSVCLSKLNAHPLATLSQFAKAQATFLCKGKAL